MGNRTRKIAEILGRANHSTGKMSSDTLDVSFENITDTGTEGTKVATGTNAERGNTQGQLRFNTDTGLAEYYDGSQFKSIDSPPIVSSISPSSLGQSVLSSSQSIVITGSNFSSTVTAKIVGDDGTEYTPASTTRNSSTQVTITTPTNLTHTNEPYDIKIENISGLSSTLADALSINDTPVFSTASGSLGTLADSDRASSNLTAISFSDEESTPTVSVTSGSIPTGLTLNSNGTWSGTANAEVSDQTYNFTVTATDGSETATRDYSITVQAPITIEFLVVGGGGSGGADDGGGGGAGGYRTSTQTAPAEGTVITVTVGDGGAAVSQSGGNGTHGNDGSDSSISGSGLTTITSAGGGGGGFRSDTDNSSGRVGADGGSGGGGSINSGGTSSGAGGSGNTPSTTPSQGNDGGASASNAPYGGGGGGGASEAGSNGVASGAAGDGGDGTANSITGSSVTYAGGGGGGNRSGTAGSGGAGGGGAGSNTSGVNATAGTVNLGGGGGGVPHSAGNSGAGGKGVVILRLLASSYSGTTSGSPTVSDDGSYKVLTFTGSGSYTV